LSFVGSNHGRDSRNAYLPAIARCVTWRLYELLPGVAAGSAITRPQTQNLSLSSGVLRRLNPVEIRTREPLAGLPVFKTHHLHVTVTYSHANARIAGASFEVALSCFLALEDRVQLECNLAGTALDVKIGLLGSTARSLPSQGCNTSSNLVGSAIKSRCYASRVAPCPPNVPRMARNRA
jgi:hypothetical protein